MELNWFAMFKGRRDFCRRPILGEETKKSDDFCSLAEGPENRALKLVQRLFDVRSNILMQLKIRITTADQKRRYDVRVSS